MFGAPKTRPPPGGGVLRNHNFRRRVLLPAAEMVGVPGLTPHNLRRTAASLAAQAGASVKAMSPCSGKRPRP